MIHPFKFHVHDEVGSLAMRHWTWSSANPKPPSNRPTAVRHRVINPNWLPPSHGHPSLEKSDTAPAPVEQYSDSREHKRRKYKHEGRRSITIGELLNDDIQKTEPLTENEDETRITASDISNADLQTSAPRSNPRKDNHIPQQTNPSIRSAYDGDLIWRLEHPDLCKIPSQFRRFPPQGGQFSQRLLDDSRLKYLAGREYIRSSTKKERTPLPTQRLARSPILPLNNSTLAWARPWEVHMEGQGRGGEERAVDIAGVSRQERRKAKPHCTKSSTNSGTSANKSESLNRQNEKSHSQQKRARAQDIVPTDSEQSDTKERSPPAVISGWYPSEPPVIGRRDSGMGENYTLHNFGDDLASRAANEAFQQLQGRERTLKDASRSSQRNPDSLNASGDDDAGGRRTHSKKQKQIDERKDSED
ncbi:hypothetical protein N431DRAFT_560753 [Stipitochalara longipes BDJ]|nr:hypothetical protein N431DRAFT_560753 [Stipitochalara longipes BDJ]